MDSKEEITPYRISSALHLCSATSPGSVAKSCSSAVIWDRRPSILFLRTVFAYRWVSQTTVDSVFQANLGMDSRGDSQDSLERTKSIYGFLCRVYGLLCGINKSGDNTRHCILIVLLWN